MQAVREATHAVRHYIGGRWDEAAGRDGRPSEPVYNPATGEVIAPTPLGDAADVDRAAAAAARAFPGWAATPVVERARVLFRFKMLLEERFEELAALVALENGKTARTRAAR
jgi:malonate-semialdehyde dehydrogenase (acetylating)/methylmalonate-semialdehyde dehydrogenase